MTQKTAVAQSYEPTPEEREALIETARRRQSHPLPKLTSAQTAPHVVTVEVAHPDPDAATAVMMKALGPTRPEGLSRMLTQLSNVSSETLRPGDTGYDDAYNATLQAVAAIAPRDGIESMLAAQMVAVHNMTLAQAGHAMTAVDPVKKDMAEKAVNRLSRTFTAQVEALKRYRSTGEQKVTVQHIAISDHAQAIVGNVTTGGGGGKKEDTTP